MTAYKRPQFQTLSSRLSQKPERLTIVTGPRQTGKTTLILQVLGKLDRPCRYVSVDELDSANLHPYLGALLSEYVEQPSVPIGGSRDTRWLVRVWEQARADSEKSHRGFILVLDEIHKIPNWSATVKGLWDADRRHDRFLHVVLLGSSPLFTWQRMSESLAGRFEVVRLTHWSFAEMSEAFGFDFQRYVYFGGYPGGASLVREQARWRAYIAEALVEPNIERDILAMQRVDKPELLKRLFQLSAEYSGQIFSYNRMLGLLQDAGNTTTLARYLDLLSSAGLITGLPKYAGAAYRRISSSPKLNVLNTALMATPSGYTFEEAKADRSYWGRLVESAVGAHLFNAGIPEHRLYYWREKNCEVDFVLTRGRRVLAFEVKSGARKPRTSGLELFADRFDVQKTMIIGEGGLPLSEFLLVPAREWFDIN